MEMYLGKPAKNATELTQNFRDTYQRLMNAFRLYDEGQFVEVPSLAALERNPS